MSKYTKRNTAWPCNCVFCRIFVHPFMRRRDQSLSKTEIEETEELAAETPQQIVNQPTVNIDELKEAVAEHVVQLTDLKFKEFSSRVNGLEEEVKRIREDVVKNIDEVKNALVEIRSAVAEAMNPFNILRTYTDQSSAEDFSRENQIIENFEKSIKRSLRSDLTKHTETSRQMTPASLEDLLQIPGWAAFKGYRKLGLSGLIRLVKWVDEMLDKAPREVVEDIVRFMRSVNAIDGEDERIVLSVIDFVYSAKRLGLSVNDQIIYIYNLAKVFKLEDKEADEELSRLATNSRLVSKNGL